MVKSPEKIKEQIEFWFFKYHRKPKEEFNGKEKFTLYKLLNDNLKTEIEEKVELRNLELPVLVLHIEESNYIINSTERFIQIENSKIETIDYKNFEWHNGFKSLIANRTASGKIISIKQDGEISEFGIRKRNGEVIYWKIPTGSPGFAFWNVTKKCELIGRKYQIEK